ncbi:hypothetical protein SAMN05216198_1394 [Halopseudomonas litoralis]|uniref:Uncharacterized protein n=1 Tax=Halopseudomonas litoralis TaxID=797277 RepID=A0A1H1Q6A2_9GAMM|nr:hypothetical protein [Halopseudomonas litoralis]SDS18946.1 hypothetical protein SAMN05216198_1394 [Halopseudomonas litoralis]
MNLFNHPFWFSLISCALLTAVLPAHAEDTNSQDAPDSCIEVVVNGQRAMPLDCYTQMMAPKPHTGHPTHNPAFDSADVAKRQPNAIGQFSQSALRIRMGSNLGQSAQPARPPR